jgi:hypothetical protein
MSPTDRAPGNTHLARGIKIADLVVDRDGARSVGEPEI